jgi:hypothetical protein
MSMSLDLSMRLDTDFDEDIDMLDSLQDMTEFGRAADPGASNIRKQPGSRQKLSHKVSPWRVPEHN